MGTSGWVVPVAVVGVLLAAGCTTAARATVVAATPPAPIKTHGVLALAVSPATGAKDLPVTTEIGTSVRGGTVADVTLTDATGNRITGSPREDGSSWVPAEPLRYGRLYTARVTATDEGQRVTRTTRFQTAKAPHGRRIGTGLYLSREHTYGVGLPIVVEFTAPIPDGAKATVQRRLFVRSDPAQTGAWRWYGDREVMYRPRQFWLPGTRITVRAALGGLPVGPRYLDVDRTGTATIGPRQEFQVDNATKRLSVYRAGQLIRRFPVSLGKASTPTSSGNLVIMSREYSTIFETPEYRIKAYYDERLTWSGQFFHAAPWSVGSQGRRNVSHGCVNLSTDNAAWVYGMAQVGDPVTIAGTPVHVQPGNGWTVWDLSWLDYLRGSALPDPVLLDAAAAVHRPMWTRPDLAQMS